MPEKNTENDNDDYVDLKKHKTVFSTVPKVKGSPERLFMQVENRLANLDDEFVVWCDEVIERLKWAEGLLHEDPTNILHWNTVSDVAHEIRGTCSNYRRDALAAVAFSLYKLTSEAVEFADNPRVIKLFQLHISSLERIVLEGDKAKLGKNHPVAVEIDTTRKKLFEGLGG